jgi:hypothetical protein
VRVVLRVVHTEAVLGGEDEVAALCALRLCDGDHDVVIADGLSPVVPHALAALRAAISPERVRRVAWRWTRTNPITPLQATTLTTTKRKMKMERGEIKGGAAVREQFCERPEKVS